MEGNSEGEEDPCEEVELGELALGEIGGGDEVEEHEEVGLSFLEVAADRPGCV